MEGYKMFNSKWKRIISKELLFVFLGLFIILGMAESITPYVVIRSTPEFSLLTFYYFSFYFLILSVRIVFWAIGDFVDSLLPQYHIKVESKAEKQFVVPYLENSPYKNIRDYKYLFYKRSDDK
jgi:hypothetical protein